MCLFHTGDVTHCKPSFGSASTLLDGFYGYLCMADKWSFVEVCVNHPNGWSFSNIHTLHHKVQSYVDDHILQILASVLLYTNIVVAIWSLDLQIWHAVELLAPGESYIRWNTLSKNFNGHIITLTCFSITASTIMSSSCSSLRRSNGVLPSSPSIFSTSLAAAIISSMIT